MFEIEEQVENFDEVYSTDTESLTFVDFKKAVSSQVDIMMNYNLFVSTADKDELWDTYLESFPEGSNPIYRERTHHDCNCCKQFVRSMGNTLAIIDDELVSIWDINIGGHYQVVADAMSLLVKRKGINTIFLNDLNNIGTDQSYEYGDDGAVIWKHFHHVLKDNFVVHRSDIAALKGKANTNNQVLARSLEMITQESIDVVIELIEQNSLYRGEEHLPILNKLSTVKSKYEKADNKDYFVWLSSLELKGASAFKNTVIGTLLVDLSTGVDLEDAVRMFESKVAPQNYKRPKSLITKAMRDKAQKTVQDLGIEDALYRRFAVQEDIKINDILFADRSIKEAAGVFDVIDDAIVSKKPNLDKVEKVTIDDFIENILPRAESIEVYMENRHSNNLVSLIAPTHSDTKNILKWNNNFSWSYNGEVTDSIRDKVKAAGGSVSGDLRCSLAWSNADDLDIHIKEPCGKHIYYGDRVNNSTGARLDVDMNAGGTHNAINPVENITWPDRIRMTEGTYKLYVNNYTKRATNDVGFEVEIEFDGVIHSFNYTKDIPSGHNVDVVTFTYSRDDGITIVKSIPSSQQSKEVWGINTNNFHKVNMIMLSPNRWYGENTGNKHFFFMMDECTNPNKARGLYNEFLNNDLAEHRKVFEILGSKLKTEESVDQLSGIGFSSTQKNTVLCKVQGSFNRIIEIQF